MSQVGRQTLPAGFQMDQTHDSGETAARLGDLHIRLSGPGKGIEHVDRQIEGLVQPFSKSRRLRTVGDVQGLYRLPLSLPGMDRQVPANLTDQARAGSEGPGQQQAPRTGDTEFRPALGDCQDRHHSRRFRERSQDRGAGHALQAGGDAEGPRREAFQLHSRSLAHLLQGQDQLTTGNQDQGPPFSRRDPGAEGSVVDDHFIGRVGQLLDRLEADHGRLLIERHGRIVNILDNDPVAAQAGQHRGGMNFGFLEPLEQLLTGRHRLRRGQGHRLGPDQRPFDAHTATAGAGRHHMKLILAPVDTQITCQVLLLQG